MSALAPRLNDECPYCTDPIIDQPNFIFSCNHLAHIECFNMAVAYNVRENRPTDCPFCREVLSQPLSIVEQQSQENQNNFAVNMFVIVCIIVIAYIICDIIVDF